ncbi:MAG: hypothetical protein F6K39_43055 [Okeania sp. SIO3B3]|nr:hypothetical protein [Okeania sp. SIO3B3]
MSRNKQQNIPISTPPINIEEVRGDISKPEPKGEPKKAKKNCKVCSGF